VASFLQKLPVDRSTCNAQRGRLVPREDSPSRHAPHGPALHSDLSKVPKITHFSKMIKVALRQRKIVGLTSTPHQIKHAKA
jgi:hypothetical protein